MSGLRFLPFLYFAPLKPGNVVTIVTDRNEVTPDDAGLLDLDLRIARPGVTDSRCDAVVIALNAHSVEPVLRTMQDLMPGDGTIIRMDRASGGTAHRIREGTRRLFGIPPARVGGRRCRWEFIVEPDLSGPRFLVRPGFRSNLPSTYGPAWRRRLKRMGAFYFLPRDTVTIHSEAAEPGAVVRALCDGTGSAPESIHLLSVYVSATGTMVVQARSENGVFFGRFPLSKRALRRTRRGYEAQAFVRSTGCHLVPDPILFSTDGLFPYALESGCSGRPARRADTTRVGSAALQAIAEIHLADGARLQSFDQDLFGQYLQPRLETIERSIGKGHMASVGRRLRSALLGKAMLIGPCHGDFKLENCLFEGSRISGIVDWDLASRDDLAVVDVANFFARRAGDQTLTQAAQRTDLIGPDYGTYLRRTGASHIAPEDLLLLWHVDRVAKQLEFGTAGPDWMSLHVPWG